MNGVAQSEPIDVFGIVPAAGIGSRLGAEVPKALLGLGEKSILEHTLATLLEAHSFKKIVITAPAASLGLFEAQVLKSLPAEDIAVIEGGEERKDSVALALEYLESSEGASEESIVLVHDAARCFVKNQLISDCIAGAKKHGAVTAAIPQVDSLKRVSDKGVVVDSVDRGELWAVQTPQVFKLSVLKQGHQSGSSEATDDANLVEPFCEVRVVEGDRRNFKITTAADYELAKRLI